MKIPKIIGAVMAAHALAFLVIFANPGCSSTQTATPPIPTETEPMAKADPGLPPPSILPASAFPAPSGDPSMAFDPNAPAVPPGRYPPTRPAAGSSGLGGPAATFDPNAPATSVAAAPAPAPAASNYTAVAGDSLWSVSKKHGLTVAELAQANRIPNTAELKIGQKLVIPSKATPPAAATPAAKSGPAPAAAKADAGLTHVVKSGETVGGIARMYGVSQADLTRVNNIANPAMIIPGTTLVIPGYQSVQTPAGKAASPAATKAGTGAQQPAAAPRQPAGDIPMIRIDEAPPRIP